MKRTAAVCALLCFLSASSSLADYTLSCKPDLPGRGASNRDTVVVKDGRYDKVDSLRKACSVMRSDPLYSDYNWRDCVDPAGKQGTCLNPALPPN